MRSPLRNSKAMPESMPRVAPVPALSAGRIFLREKMTSPMNAPTKGQTRIPMIGVKKIEPMMAPRRAPMMPDFALPNTLAPMPPVILSITRPRTKRKARITHCHQVSVSFPMMPCHNAPAPMRMMPGIRGMIVPIRPRANKSMVGIQMT